MIYYQYADFTIYGLDNQLLPANARSTKSDCLKVIAAMTRQSAMAKQKIFQCSQHAAANCALLIKSGGVVIYPTDTIYGIGCDPYNDFAVKRIFTIKGRDEKKSLPILTSSIVDAERIVSLSSTCSSQQLCLTTS